MRYLLLAAFVACVVAANVTTQRLGMVKLGPFLVPSGTPFAGLTFSIRDALHDRGRWPWVLGAIGAGTAVSALVAPDLALASGVAFLWGELSDFAVYSPLRARGRARAVFVSGVVGSVVDSVLFLWLAPFPVTLAGVAGVVLVKVVVTAIAALAMRGKR